MLYAKGIIPYGNGIMKAGILNLKHSANRGSLETMEIAVVVASIKEKEGKIIVTLEDPFDTIEAEYVLSEEEKFELTTGVALILTEVAAIKRGMKIESNMQEKTETSLQFARGNIKSKFHKDHELAGLFKKKRLINPYTSNSLVLPSLDDNIKKYIREMKVIGNREF